MTVRELQARLAAEAPDAEVRLDVDIPGIFARPTAVYSDVDEMLSQVSGVVVLRGVMCGVRRTGEPTLDFRALLVKYACIVRAAFDGLPTFYFEDFDEGTFSDVEWKALEELGLVPVEERLKGPKR